MIRPMWRIVCLALVVGATGILPTGCGSTSITKAQAVAFAEAVNLRAADLPGWKPLPPAQPETPTGLLDPAYSRCVDAKPPRKLAEKQSPGFQLGHLNGKAEIVTSSVEVAASTSAAADAMPAVRSPRGHSCAEQMIRAESNSTLTFDRASWAVAPAPIPDGLKDTLAGTFTYPSSTRRTQVLGDLVVFTSGAAIIVFADFSWGSSPRSSVERRLLALLYSRAKSRKL
jgi:hypothetical protein